MKTQITMLLVVGMIVALAGTATADTITFQEGVNGYTHDATTLREHDQRDLNGDAWDNMYLGSYFDTHSRALMDFDLSSLGAAGMIQIDSITLTVTQYTNADASINKNITYALYETTTDWVSSEATWNNRLVPDYDNFPDVGTAWDAGTYTDIKTGDTYAGGGDYGPEISNFVTNPTDLDEGETFTWGSTAAFVTAAQNAFDDDGHLELLAADTNTALGASAGGIGSLLRLASDDYGTVAYRPLLTVEYTPEPATMSLLALGGLALLRRRRRA